MHDINYRSDSIYHKIIAINIAISRNRYIEMIGNINISKDCL